MSRFSPPRVRAAYAKALAQVPIPAQTVAAPDPSALTVLGSATIDGRAVEFGVCADAPRLWVAFADAEPALLGFLSGLVVGEPDLWVCETTHLSWIRAGTNAPEVKRAAAKVWFDCQKFCEG
ncbi:hypothetical protein L0U85_13390 [Glycomyces sp. L485]|uniref:hypothetical protein n=1 Tax=Glycomyces sp. L485 TaxID=2909235 RepID=UPI001F4B0543|nr:hypothetical protein [Glycomyces sp. L485]MCH7231839.1 hypothetical protein [Glycomyces sp. L485]